MPLNLHDWKLYRVIPSFLSKFNSKIQPFNFFVKKRIPNETGLIMSISMSILQKIRVMRVVTRLYKSYSVQLIDQY